MQRSDRSGRVVRLSAVAAFVFAIGILLVSDSLAQSRSSSSGASSSGGSSGGGYPGGSGAARPSTPASAAIAKALENYGKVPPSPAEPKYAELPVTLDPKVATDLKNKVADVIRGEPLDPVSADFDRYFKELVLPEFTKVANIDRLANDRRRFKQSFLFAAAKNPEAHRRINDLVIEQMRGVTIGNFHPFVRYNAMLMIADLNSREPTRSEPAIPYAPALTTLMRALKYPSLPDGPRVAALYGVLRHAKAGIPDGVPDASKPEVQKMAQAIAGQAQAPAHRDEDAHMWLRMRGADILLAMGQRVPQLQLPPAPEGPEFAGDYPERVKMLPTEGGAGGYGSGSYGGGYPSGGSSGGSSMSR